MGSYLQTLRGKMDKEEHRESIRNTEGEITDKMMEAKLEGLALDTAEHTCDASTKTSTERNNPKNSTDIVREDVELPTCFKGKLAFLLYNVISKEECDDYIKKTESMGYSEALVNVGNGRQRLIKDVRNNTRCIWDSVKEADKIWQRIKQYIPDTWRERKVMGLNERLRFLRYFPGEYFAPHMDGMYKRDNGERSYITIQLYLNQGFKGGSTTFMSYSEKERVEVVPKTGMVLVFQHDILHEGSELLEGTKYTMRTDIMYSPELIKENKA